MKVRRLKIKNFRGLSDLELEFKVQEPMVLVGVNGVGKSSILDCLTILLSQFTGRLQDSLSMRFFDDKDIMNGRQSLECEITIVEGEREISWSLQKERPSSVRDVRSTGMKRLEAIKSILYDVNEEQLQALSQKRNELSKALQAVTVALDFIEEEGDNQTLPSLQAYVDELATGLSTSNINLPVIVSYPVNRAVLEMPLDMTQENIFSQVNAYDQALTGGRIDFKGFFEWFRNREDLENEQRRNNPDYRDIQLETARNAISSLQPDFTDLHVIRASLQMMVKKQGQELVVNQLSDGEKCLLALVGDLARRLATANPYLANPLLGDGVVLIDEIELHLHPKWQREIVPALKRTFPNCQFIVSTHSPQIVSHIKPDNIYIITATPDGVTLQQPENSFGRDSNQILEDLMGVSERPQQIKNGLSDLFKLIDQGNLETAKQLRQNLATQIGEDDPEFVRADVLIRRKEILNR
ncbi:ATPase [Dulcicalothrix desertica PCC 7102]|uniref:ATPase n=1 Tax=Dulcicalothrix desertica PCC 7102 TaxID=232991 RepID=A0A3S1B5E6_9CYAN|nr:AAA family ATPase [Dulcicalothrix desertica]RUT05178.1 ATPase [Dulcicalothrix desertica PCC 7102]TWH43317.1 putative ATP-binding protein involved in virulence [Dulcicalothrix desertica PCC 7102]